MTSLALPRALSSRMAAHPLALVAAAGLALRLLLLGNARLWYDEAGSLWMASLPFDRMLAATAGDAHPPLYLALLWAWIRVAGASETMLRLPSAAASALCIPLAYAIAQRLGLSFRAALASAALVALLPAQLYYAQEARMYALLSLEVALALYAALGRQWVLFGLSLALGYWTHNYGLLFAVPLNAIALWQIRRSGRPIIFAEMTRWLWANAIAFAAWLPWLSVLAGQMQTVAAGYWLPPATPGGLLYALYMIVWAFTPGPALQAHAALLVFGAGAFAAWRALRTRHAGALCCLAFTAIAFAVPVIISVTWRPVLLFRGLLPVSIPLCILFAWALVDGIDAKRRLAAAAIALPVLLSAGVLYYVQVPEQKGDARLLELVAWKPGDILYHVNDGSLQLAHVYAPPAWPQYELPATWQDIGVLSDGTRAAYGVQIAPLEMISWRRAWVIYAANPMTASAEDQAVQALLESYPHQVRYERVTEFVHQAVYLVWNHGVGVP